MPVDLAGSTEIPAASSGVAGCGRMPAPAVAPIGITTSWDAFGMAAAQLASTRSKDPSTKAGAAILDRKNRLAATGYNGFARGVPDDPGYLGTREIKYGLVIHAEVNAILFAQRDLEGCTIYVWPAPPCSACAAVIAQVGIRRVVAQTPTADFLDRWGKSCDLAQWVYKSAGIEYVEMSL